MKRLMYETVLRYVLGLTMLAYGLIKITGYQFILPADVYEEQLKNIDGVTMTWVFLAYSPWFSTLLGFLEAIPAVLLMFHKTRLIGAILIFPVLINVFLINMAYGFLSHMQLLSGGLLVMNILLILSHYRLLKEFYKRTMQSYSSSKNEVRELIVNIILVGGMLFLMFFFTGSGK